MTNVKCQLSSVLYSCEMRLVVLVSVPSLWTRTYIKADRNPCLIVNIKCRQAFPSSLFPVSHMTPAGRRGIQPGNNPWKTSSLTNLIHTSMSSLHVAALFARTAFTTVLPVHQNVEKKKLWSNYTWQAFQNDWGQRTRDRGGSKWAVTLNDAGILF